MSSHTPEIRFKGFTENWETRKLGEISDKITEKNTSELFSETLTNSAEFGIVSQREYFEKDISNKKNIDGYYVVRPNNFVYNPRISKYAPVGPINRNNLIRTGIMSPLYYVFKTHNINNDYLEKYFLTRYWHKFMFMNGDTGARADRFAIKNSTFVKMSIPYPIKEEQKKIGNFFKELDGNITLHQHALDLLIQRKKAFLQKMFPKKGESVPEVHFSEFTKNWNKKKLKEVGEISTGKTPSTSKEEYYNDKGMLWITPTDIKGNITNETSKRLSPRGQKESRIVPSGSILVTCIASIGKNTMVKENASFNQQINAVSPNEEYDSYFLLTQSYFWSRKMKLFASKGTMQIVNKGDFSNLTFKVPSLEEQQMIGNFFKELDNSITLQEEKIESLKQMKKAFLQKMFV